MTHPPKDLKDLKDLRDEDRLAFTPATSEKAADALRELAQEFAIADVDDPDSIRRMILYREYERGSRVRQLEARADVLERHTLPYLKEELRQANVEASAWRDRARSAERRTATLLWWHVALVVLGLLGCVAIPLLAY